MAKKKFGKFLLFSAAVGAVAAGAYYYFQNKEKISNDDFDGDDDFDDFSEDLDSDKNNHSDNTERSYVSLDMDTREGSSPEASSPEGSSQEASSQKASSGTVAEKTAESDNIAKEALSNLEKAAESAKAEVEEFFDEEEDDAYNGN